MNILLISHYIIYKQGSKPSFLLLNNNYLLIINFEILCLRGKMKEISGIRAIFPFNREIRSFP